MAKYFNNESIIPDYVRCSTPHGFVCFSRDAFMAGLWRTYRILKNSNLKFLGYARGNKADPLQLYRSFLSNQKDMQVKLEKKS